MQILSMNCIGYVKDGFILTPGIKDYKRWKPIPRKTMISIEMSNLHFFTKRIGW